jgi:translation initiation factor IF-3
VAANGDMLGVMPTRDARQKALDAGLDLVEVSPNADPPVCRIMDFGKHRYDETRKQKLARKNSHAHAVKEIKFHANVGEHDYQTKLKHIRTFLEKGHKVKVSLMFRGRENAHRELGFEVINKVIKDCDDLAVVEMTPRLMGRTVGALMGVKPQKI